MGQPKLRTKDGNYERLESMMQSYRYVMDPTEFQEILDEIGSDAAALDFETTGLDPNYSHVRLSCIYHPDVGICLIDHHSVGSFKSWVARMSKAMWVVYNAKFELRWFENATADPTATFDMIDVDFLAKARRGGSHSSLKVMAKRDLWIEMDKEEQLSDWSAMKLTRSQLDYAARDAGITWMLFDLWMSRTTQAHRHGAYIFQDAVSATVECEQTGLVLDTDLHMKNIDKWNMKAALMLKVVRKYMPPHEVNNVNSNKQVSDWLKRHLGDGTKNIWPSTAKTGQLTLNRKQVAPIAAKSPYPFSRFLNAFLRYRFYQKYLSTYGETLVTKQYLEDCITYRLNISQAATGRYSSSSINIQNIPRAPWVRRAFLPPNGYEYLVVADYSGVEVRVLAELSGDERLKHDAIYGDVHSASASAIYGINEAEFLDVITSEGDRHANIRPVYKEFRSKAKGFTFQNVYGAAAAALSIVLKCTVAEAEEALRAWAARYPQAYNYRHIMFDHLMRDGYLPVCDGRTIFVPKADRTVPVAANYGIQGAAASVMYRAMFHTKFLRDELSTKRDIVLAATVHDEILLGVRTLALVEPAKSILVRGMERGWLDIFPGTTVDNLVEAKHGKTWGDAK
ncbi:MAG: hypothetical protein GKR86_00125 [Ilumatobacter sp.]|nr:hypothetical protein [Ilumatobacter sp.]